MSGFPFSQNMRTRTAELVYLNDASKVMAALANEYGRDTPLPSRAYIQKLIDNRRQSFARFRARSEQLGEGRL